MFEKFQDYMYYLLYGPLKKITKLKNQFYILFKVFGKVFDQTKQDIFRVREESMIISASEKMLEEHGRDRVMKRLKGESVENYRMRLSMKNIIAEKAGTNEGILLALKALGYEQSRIEPFYIHDPDRWAEFTIYLASKQQSGVNDITVIDSEVMKVKPASGLPAYGIEESTQVEIRSSFKSGFSKYPLCNNLLCGVWPYNNDNVGYLLSTTLNEESSHNEGSFSYPLTGELAASEELYQEIDFVQLEKESSTMQTETEFEGNTISYPLCNQIKAGQYPN
jgi:hypothetical protein